VRQRAAGKRLTRSTRAQRSRPRLISSGRVRARADATTTPCRSSSISACVGADRRRSEGDVRVVEHSNFRDEVAVSVYHAWRSLTRTVLWPFGDDEPGPARLEQATVVGGGEAGVDDPHGAVQLPAGQVLLHLGEHGLVLG
jgi:hypothetical protein